MGGRGRQQRAGERAGRRRQARGVCSGLEGRCGESRAAFEAAPRARPPAFQGSTKPWGMLHVACLKQVPRSMPIAFGLLIVIERYSPHGAL